MAHKFLSDGRKVIVIGKLNNNETIVQEIFVTEGGDEIPSGERFVTRSLHDQPVESYVDKQIKRKKEHLAGIEAEIKKMNEEKYKSYEKLRGHREILRSVKKLTELVPESELDIFVGVLSGTIEWLVVDDWGITPPIPFSDAIIRTENIACGKKRFNSLKLMSVFGKSSGDLGYALHQYSDDSGSWHNVSPFNDYLSAIEHIKNKAIRLIEREELDEGGYKRCVDMGIVFDEKHEKLYKERLLKSRLLQLEIARARKKEAERVEALREKEVAELSQDNS